MNTPHSPPPNQVNSNGFALIFGLAIGVLSLIATVIITSYLCYRKSPPPDPSAPSDDDDSVAIDILVLDETALKSFPKLSYSQVKLNGSADSSLSCPICLAEFLENDSVRLLPNCRHFFHFQCVDPWLKAHGSCPMCRKSLVQPDLQQNQMAPVESRRVFFDPWFLQLRR